MCGGRVRTHTIASATSRGSRILKRLSSAACAPGVPVKTSANSVNTCPGETAVTRIGLLRARSSWRSASVRARTANLVAAYIPLSGPGTRCAASEATCTTCPAAPRRSMSWIASRVAMARPRTFTSSISRQSSVGAEPSGAARPRPALLTRMSTPPKRSRATAKRRRMSASRRMSVGCTATFSPPSSAARRSRRSARRARRRLRPDAARRAGDHGGLAGEQTCHGGLLRPLDPPRQRCELTRMPVDLKAVGKKLGAVTHTYGERDVMLYALGVGCGTDDLQFTYERDLKVLPTFAVIPSFPAMLNLGDAMDVNPAMVLHGEQRIELHAEIPTSGTITTTPMIKAIYDKVKGALVVVETESVDPKGRLLFRNTAGIFARGEGGFGGDRGPSGPRNLPPDRPPDKSIAMKTLPQQALLYRLSGDMNPLHADPDFAKLGGYDRPILHGLCTYGHAGRAVLKAYCNNEPARMKSLEVRFSGVVYPGETITTDMWQIAPGKIVLTARTERGEAVLSSAAAEVVP